ncbi:GGDEF domain-containing protein [Lacrimispora sp. 210928-DFI.3.58]|uniref:GGDEF domain-containing protein n=1 Tax=Lacrimispora sp. 210928-DFI.3.58 TaxID=2883214 RepID=UPI001D06BBCE|nr:diguanylate cyclase [Lacrimispora sp. 210928-DFI.3.58]MCB7319427.1 diguanylate cyclase [Lacrimispora sp. 210928-DFI.3.58]
MKRFELSRYIKKWLPLIILVCAGLTAAIYLFLSKSQAYIASAVIEYKSVGADEGKTPLGTELDVNAIKSSAIVSKAIGNLKLDSRSYSVDKLISSIKITEVIDEDEEARKEAVLEDGEEYVYKPTKYIVSFEADHNENEDFARRVLDEILDLYFSDFSEKYVNIGSTTNSLSSLYEGNYDYIEMMEIIDGNITENLKTLTSQANGETGFRSSATGMSFADLVNELNYIRSVKVSGIFSEIFKYQITKDKNLLISKYTERIKQYGISNQAEEEKIADVLELIEAYVQKMRESDNTNITYEYILDEVYQKDLIDSYGDVIGQGDQTVTYDKLIFSWRDHNEKKEYAIIDSAYCNYIIDVFSSCTGACPEAKGISVNAHEKEGQADEENAGEENSEAVETACMRSDLTCTELNMPEYGTIVTETEDSIRSLISELEQVFEIVDATNEEYNEYLGAYNISTLSTVAVKEKINVKLYTSIAALFLMVVCCCSAILIGRMNDIVQYVFYTDHMTGLNNRVAFDNYLKNHDKKLLDEGVVCAAIVITNQPEINRGFGREAGDSLIRFFADNLKELFNKTGAYLVYNGNAQFVVVAGQTDIGIVEQILKHFQLVLDKREILQAVEIKYDIGISGTHRDQVHRIRTLLSKAVGSQVKYVSPALKEGESV